MSPRKIFISTSSGTTCLEAGQFDDERLPGPCSGGAPCVDGAPVMMFFSLSVAYLYPCFSAFRVIDELN